MNLRRRALSVLGVLALPFLIGHGLAAVEIVELGIPGVVTVFADSVQAVVYELEGRTFEDIEDLVAGRARLELTCVADAGVHEYSAAICCLPEDPDWEAALQAAIPSVKAVGPGTSYFQATANLVEYGTLCSEETALYVIIWASTSEGQGDPASSIATARLFYDVE